ncbi:TIGR03086 family metal-binding protein [Nonomuraea candida]|uniref:TIGR03086 family metal-binding protein n=1 Tax=Nonomuraea candida TaxID=359159 RepID=UPI0005BA1E85|nr:TIGR03086 family metal-binding protein [Nonomuraea candida]
MNAGPDLAADSNRALTAGVALLERAIDYALGSLRIVTPNALCRPTPCSGWTLRHLLEHMHDSLQTLNEAATTHHIPAQTTHTTALALRDDALEVLGRWAALLTDRTVSIGDRHLTSPMVAAVGAIEISVHAWDVAGACGEHHPIPPLLAEELLDLALLFVTRADRPQRFAPPVRVPECAPAQDHLLAYLGRHPDWFVHN